MHSDHYSFLGILKGIFFGFKSECGNQKKKDGLWDSTKANCSDCFSIYREKFLAGEKEDL